MSDEFKLKVERYLHLMQKHYDKVKDDVSIDLMNNTQNCMSLDEALKILEGYEIK